MITVVRIIHRLRDRSGQVGLEMLAVLAAWLITATMMINLLLYFGSAMLMQSAVNRAAMQAGALGCVSTQEGGVLPFLNGLRALGTREMTVTARSPYRVSNNPQSDDFWRPNMTGVFTPNGDLVGGEDASCNGRDTIGAGRYIVVQIHYKQKLWVFGTTEVRRDATVLSHNMEELR